ncbi:MAG: carboxymuconolactone decarboxylase family protein [Acidobacteriota bacterium]
MAVVKPIPKEQASPEIQPIYDEMAKAFGHMPNIFAVMAHRPAALKSFVPFYTSVMGGGSIEDKYKELAYLKTSLLNGCEY